jgi:hypothetical protein
MEDVDDLYQSLYVATIRYGQLSERYQDREMYDTLKTFIGMLYVSVITIDQQIVIRMYLILIKIVRGPRIEMIAVTEDQVI